MTLEQIIFIIFSFLVGSLPFAIWVGHFGIGVDIRKHGDGNPGAFNVYRAGGVKWFMVALVLDISKGATPIGLAYQVFGWSEVTIVLVAIAPIFGHAFSPLLGFNGGKAIATTFGIWIGLTLWAIPLIAMTTLIVAYKLLDSSAWAVIIMMFAMLSVLLISNSAIEFYIVWVINLFLILYTHRNELAKLPRFRTQASINT